MKSKVLLISLRDDWVACSRLAKPLHEAGFAVEAVCRPQAFLAKTRFVDRHIFIESRLPVFSRFLSIKMIKILRQSRPQWVIPGDEDAVELLMDVKRLAELGGNTEITDLLRTSLWKEAFHNELRCKKRFVRLLSQWQISTPDYQTLASYYAEGGSKTLPFPLILKGNFGSGGSGVIYCRNELELADGLRLVNLSRLQALWFKLKSQCFYDVYSSKLEFDIQRYIVGTPGMFVFVARQGQLLAGFSALAVQTHPKASGPSSVIEGIELPELQQNAANIIAKVGYNGFGCFDFMYEAATGIPFVIEMNTRPVPASHLDESITGVNLCKAYADALQGKSVPWSRQKPFTVALFPSEYRRNQASPYFAYAFHDVPEDDPQLLAAMEPGYSEVQVHDYNRKHIVGF